MDKEVFFNFKTDVSKIDFHAKLNNPFDLHIPEIANIAATEFQDFISSESKAWKHDFRSEKGKMFGVLVIQNEDGGFSYLGAVSGKLPGNATCNKLIPSVFDDSVDDFFINRGMTELTEMSGKIKKANNQSEIISLTASRREKSFALQQQLFENYKFLNIQGKEQNVLQIFKNSSHANPPSAAGECAAPKLLQYAFKYHLKPIALAEFWWGSPPKNEERVHKGFYPACKNKCRPILEFMLNDTELYNRAKKG